MRRILLFVALATVLAGCQFFKSQATDTPAIKAADKESTQIRDECAKRHASGELTLTQSVQCSNPRIIAAFDAAHYPYMDLLRLGMDARLAGAEKVEKGEITPDEYQSQLSELRGRVADEIDARNGATVDAAKPPAQTETIDPAAKAKLLQGLSAFSSLLQQGSPQQGTPPQSAPPS